jgi:hypothetical protein
MPTGKRGGKLGEQKGKGKNNTNSKAFDADGSCRLLLDVYAKFFIEVQAVCHDADATTAVKLALAKKAMAEKYPGISPELLDIVCERFWHLSRSAC